MALALSEINSTLLKERLKNGQNCTENAPLGTPDGLILRTRLKKVVEAETLAYYISPHNDFQRNRPTVISKSALVSQAEALNSYCSYRVT